MYKLIITCLIISNVSYGQDAISLKKDSPAPYDGILFTPDAAQKVNQKLIELDATKNINLSLTQERDIYKERLQFYQDDNKQLSERIQHTETSTWQKTFFFVAGALITGTVAYGVYRSK